MIAVLVRLVEARAVLYFGREATADKIDREYAARRAELEAAGEASASG